MLDGATLVLREAEQASDQAEPGVVFGRHAVGEDDIGDEAEQDDAVGMPELAVDDADEPVEIDGFAILALRDVDQGGGMYLVQPQMAAQQERDAAAAEWRQAARAGAVNQQDRHRLVERQLGLVGTEPMADPVQDAGKEDRRGRIVWKRG